MRKLREFFSKVRDSRVYIKRWVCINFLFHPQREQAYILKKKSHSTHNQSGMDNNPIQPITTIDTSKATC